MAVKNKLAKPKFKTGDKVTRQYYRGVHKVVEVKATVSYEYLVECPDGQRIWTWTHQLKRKPKAKAK
jgi:hypothetical protein